MVGYVTLGGWTVHTPSSTTDDLNKSKRLERGNQNEASMKQVPNNI